MAVRMSSINIIIINRLKNRCDYVLCLTFNVYDGKMFNLFTNYINHTCILKNECYVRIINIRI